MEKPIESHTAPSRTNSTGAAAIPARQPTSPAIGIDHTRRDAFAPGTTVIYGMHGRCQIVSIETRQIGSESQAFFKLEIQKSPLSRSQRQEPAIWIPVQSAQERGLRLPLSAPAIDAVSSVLSNREFYFSLSDSWSAILPKLEQAVRQEGAIGLAKVESYLAVLRRREVILPPEIGRFAQTISRLLVRELSEASGEPSKIWEARLQKLLRNKLLPDH